MSKVKAQLTALAAHDPRADTSDLDGFDDLDVVETEETARAV